MRVQRFYTWENQVSLEYKCISSTSAEKTHSPKSGWIEAEKVTKYSFPHPLCLCRASLCFQFVILSQFRDFLNCRKLPKLRHFLVLSPLRQATPEVLSRAGMDLFLLLTPIGTVQITSTRQNALPLPRSRVSIFKLPNQEWCLGSLVPGALASVTASASALPSFPFPERILVLGCSLHNHIPLLPREVVTSSLLLSSQIQLLCLRHIWNPC